MEIVKQIGYIARYSVSRGAGNLVFGISMGATGSVLGGELRNRLRFVTVKELKIFLAQVANRFSVAVSHHNVYRDKLYDDFQIETESSWGVTGWFWLTVVSEQARITTKIRQARKGYLPIEFFSNISPQLCMILVVWGKAIAKFL